MNAPSAATFFTDGGREVPSSVLTKAMVRTLDSVDDQGRLTGSSATLNRLVGLGLAEDRRILGVFITGAGWNALCLFPPAPEHRTRTFESSSSERTWRVKPSGPALGWHPINRSASAECSCGWHYKCADRAEARMAARAHRFESAEVEVSPYMDSIEGRGSDG